MSSDPMVDVALGGEGAGSDGDGVNRCSSCPVITPQDSALSNDTAESTENSTVLPQQQQQQQQQQPSQQQQPPLQQQQPPLQQQQPPPQQQQPPLQQQQPPLQQQQPPLQQQQPPPQQQAAMGGAQPPPRPPPPPTAPASAVEQCLSHGGAARLDQEVQLVAFGISELLPAWQRRLDVAFGRPTPLVCDFNLLLASCATPQARLDAAETLLQPSGLFKTSPAIGLIVQAFEVACSTPARATILQEVQEVHIVSAYSVTRGIKQVFLATQASSSHKIFVCSGLYERGLDGAFKQAEIAEYLEERFHVQERALVTLFRGPQVGILAQMEIRLASALGKPVKLVCDIDAILDQLEDQTKRLNVARLLCHEVGVRRTLGKASVAANSFVNKYFGSAGQQEAPSPPLNIGCDGPTPIELYSPNVIFPLVAAVENASRDATNRLTLSTSLAEVHVLLSPGRHSVTKTLSLHRTLGGPALAPRDFWAPNPPTGCVLVYTASLEAGQAGCLGETDIANFFESFFRVHERMSINRLMQVTIPNLCDRLRNAIGTDIAIEILWSTLYPERLSFDRDARTDITNTLCRNDSQLVLGSVVDALVELSKNVDARNVFASTIEHIVIQGVDHPGSMLVSLVNYIPQSAAATVPIAGSMSQSPLDAPGAAPGPSTTTSATPPIDDKLGPPVPPGDQQQQQQQQQQPTVPGGVSLSTPDTLLVSCSPQDGARGCISYVEMKGALRSIFRLPNTEGVLTDASQVISHEARRFEEQFVRATKSLQQRLFSSWK